MIGTVYLIGAGPGDPDLITVKGLKALQAADVVLYDRLAAPELLAETRAGAELIDVGKLPTKYRLAQEAINALLVEKAQQGLAVARLKGGDPFVFGRGGEEALACYAAGVPFVVIPGVSSAVAVPAYAGVPVTHRHVATAFTVFAGHEDPSKTESSIDYAALAQIAKMGTLVLLMGIGRLEAIMQQLSAQGVDPQLPAVCIEWGTTARQRVVEGTIATLAALVAEADLQPPATTVIGAVAALRGAGIRWFEGEV
jgi:uroporphyrin-III C-methyltransferase